MSDSKDKADYQRKHFPLKRIGELEGKLSELVAQWREGEDEDIVNDELMDELCSEADDLLGISS